MVNVNEIVEQIVSSITVDGNVDFDDPHLPAIAQVTKCRLICSDDKRSIKYQ